MLASTFMDMVLGLDIHFEMVPMPAPTPTPIPNPFVGVVFDPGGLLCGQAMGLVEALLSGVPPKGPVLINGFPATTVGTNAINSMGVPHILIPPGVSWAPMPKLPKPAFKGPPPAPGPPVAPEGDAIIVFGSPTVTLMGTSASRMGDKAMSCGEPVRLPSSTILAIPKGMPVMIGGPPALSISDALGALLKSKWVAGYLHDLLSRMSPGRLRNLLSMAVCFLTGHPVDVATGRVLTSQLDWELPGPLPLKFERFYSSAWANRSGPLGHGWSHALDQAVWTERGKVVYLDGEGREIEFDTFDLPDHAIRTGQSVYDPITRLTLTATGTRRFEIETAEGEVHQFEPVDGAAGPRKWWARLVRKTARDGATIELQYDRDANLAWVHDSAGRQIGFEHDQAGRLLATKLPHPSQSGWQVHTRFSYDAAGDLIAATDPLGHAWRFAYKQHLLVQETNRNGLSFYFAYDGQGEDAYCVRTWGDGGIYDHVIVYDKPGKVTSVTNSLGHTTTYKMNVVGCVVEVINALGASSKYVYDERTLQKLEETNPVGGVTTWQYDARGNATKVTGPDGAIVEMEFNPRNQPVRAIDPVKGEWQWGYDGRGRLIGRIDPLDRRVQFDWQGDAELALQGPAGGRSGAQVKRLVRLTDPAGQQTALGYDRHGNLTSLRTPDGAETRWQYDNLGRCTATIDPRNNKQVMEHDDLGRVVRVWNPDGIVRELAYDPEGDVVHARDQQRDVRFAYQGVGRLAARTEAGTTIGFRYDTEERLIAITNQHGVVYGFELGPTGAVDVELGFDGVRRQYQRDAAGRATKVFRPENRETEYAYDAAGRVVSAQHHTGEAESYRYRIDGELLEATNETGTVVFERDLLGRVVREMVGDDWIASDYDALGARVRIRSSKGLHQRITRDALGRPVGMQARLTPGAGEPDATANAGPSWEARIVRDLLGQEIERSLPGGVQARWERDAMGRPVKREIWSAGQFRHAVQYTWEPSDRLRMIIDATRGPTRYEHDAVGNLAAASHADGRIDLRMPDAVGNLFRTRDRTDRRYGPAGQLLEARDAAGAVTRYGYDAEGNLIQKVEVVGESERIWRYEWSGAGLLAKVLRPDGEAVVFAYDALARRVSKSFRGRTTRWIWDGAVPLHEWVEGPTDAGAGPSIDEVQAAAIAARHRAALLNERPSQGPPEPGSRESPITWLFDPESFAPAAKLVGEARYAITTDHLGTPTAMFDQAGAEVWSATIDAFGELHHLDGARAACPFRWPGQYEDEETGLYYNRFRYYDPAAETFLSIDPTGLEGGFGLYSYVPDPTIWIDPLGLTRCGPTDTIVLGEGMDRVKSAVKDLQQQGVASRWYQAWSKNFHAGMTPAEVDAAIARNERWLADKIAKGATIYDIGPQVGRATPSPFYAAEKAMLARLGIVPKALPGY